MPLPCVVYNATGPIQVRWYHSQNGNPADAEELNITAGGRYTVEESKQSPSASSRYANCTEGDQLYRNTLNFSYSDGDSGSYWCRIVIGGDILFELSETWTVQNFSGGPATCGPDSQTDPKCAGQISPILASTTLLVQSTPTNVVRAISAPSVSVTTVTHSPVETLSAWSTSVPTVPSSYYSSAPAPSPECGGTPCSVYGLAAGLGALTLILLVGGTVSVLVCIKLYLQRTKKIASKLHSSYMRIAKPMRLFSKNNYYMVLTCLNDWAVCTSNLKEIVSHSSKGSLILQALASSIVILSLLSSLNARKATGADGISAKMLKLTGSSIVNSLVKLFNLSLKSGIFPSDWKFARVVPIPKRGNHQSPSNYRPISILPIISKLLEKHVHNLLFQHLSNNCPLSPNQWGFTEGKSTTTALLSFTHE